MSGHTWTPPDIAAICPEQLAPITQCSSAGYMFLALLSQLYSGSKDIKLTEPLPENWDHSIVNPSTLTHFYDTEVPLGPITLKASDIQSKQPLGPTLLTYDDYFLKKFSGPIRSSTEVRSHGPGGSHGVSQVSSYFPTFEIGSDKYKKREPEFDFETPFPGRYRVRNLDFGFEKKFPDTELANSEKVTVKAEKKKSKSARKRRQASDRYDFIVVGAGSAGCVIANRLSEVKQWKILLIEAGPEEPDVTSVPAFAPVLGRSSIDWNYRTQPEEMTCRAQRGQTCAWLSGRVMGGSSAINYVVYMRGNAKDYDEWEALGNEGWGFRQVLPYFKKSENNRNVEVLDEEFHGTGGPLNVERFAHTDLNVGMLVMAFREKGFPLIDFNGKEQLGTMTTQTTTKDGRRISSNHAFIKPIRNKRPNLTIMTNAQVIKVLIKKEKIAFGVRYSKNNEVHNVYATKEVILSAGALNSPKILMLSGIGPKLDLQQLSINVKMDLKVGYNLQDHVTTEAVLMNLSNETATSVPANEMLKVISEFHNYGIRFDEISATGPLQITAFHRTKYASDDITVPDIQFHFDGRNKNDFYSDPSTYLATNIFPFSFYDSINVRPILLHPESRGYITLNTTHPVYGQPLIYPGFFTVKKDLDTLVAALKFATKLEETEAFRKNKVTFIKKPLPPCSPHKWGTYKYFACVLKSYTGTIYHPAGTCKMGPRHDEDAVVDARLRVYGIRNLRVADASIMPHIVRGNTNAPCMMIGEKVADMIKEDWETIYWEP